MTYIVQGMTLIPQTKAMSCWYASAQMLINWKMEQRQQSMMGLIPPDLDAQCARIRDDNKGIQNPQILKMAKRLGLEAIPPVSPTPQALEGWLQTYGPLWVNGRTHIVVIAGIDRGTSLLVYDPSPIGIGRVEWRSMWSWYAMGTSASSRDTGKDVETVFLYVPNTF